MPSAPPPELEPLADVLAREGAEGAVRALYGAPTLAPRGVVHVASGWDGPNGRRTIRITDASPKSAWDAFVLGLARARADAIVLTGAILRAEPALRYDLDPPLAAYRRALGKHEAPELWVLTTGRGFEPDHPALHGAFRPVVFTPRGVTLAAPGRIDRRELPAGGLRELLARTRAECPDTLVAIEAGPTTHGPLYDDPVRIDELLLTLYEGPLVSDLQGGAMLEADALEAKLGAPRSERRAREPGGVFRFLRYRRDGAP
jgi:hypothetical protein